MTNRSIRTVELSKPIKIGQDSVKELKLREPSAGELRGLSLIDLLKMDAAAMSKLIPRICDPGLDAAHLDSLPMGDFVALSVAAQGFFAVPAAAGI